MGRVVERLGTLQSLERGDKREKMATEKKVESKREKKRKQSKRRYGIQKKVMRNGVYERSTDKNVS